MRLLIHSGSAIPRPCYRCSFSCVRAEGIHLRSTWLLRDVLRGAVGTAAAHWSVALCSLRATWKIKSKEHHSGVQSSPCMAWGSSAWDVTRMWRGQGKGVGRIPTSVGSWMVSAYATGRCQNERHLCFGISGSCQTGELQKYAYISY